LIKFRSKSTGAEAASSPKETIKYCEQYRAQLTDYCMQYFECEREYAEDCVQDAYLALLENLNNGIVIKNYKAAPSEKKVQPFVYPYLYIRI